MKSSWVWFLVKMFGACILWKARLVSFRDFFIFMTYILGDLPNPEVPGVHPDACPDLNAPHNPKYSFIRTLLLGQEGSHSFFMLVMFISVSLSMSLVDCRLARRAIPIIFFITIIMITNLYRVDHHQYLSHHHCWHRRISSNALLHNTVVSAPCNRYFQSICKFSFKSILHSVK